MRTSLTLCSSSWVAVGLSNLATVEGDINLGSHDGRFHARILGAVARKSSDDATRRIKRKNAERYQELVKSALSLRWE